MNFDLAVVDEQEVTGSHILRQTLEGRAGKLTGADDVFGGDLEDVADGEVVWAALELAETDLGALEVDHDGDGAARVLGGLAHVGVDLFVHGI